MKVPMLIGILAISTAAYAQAVQGPPIRLRPPKTSTSPTYPPLAGQWDLRLSNTGNPPPGQVGGTEFTFDVTVQSVSDSSEVLGNPGLEDHALANSACIADDTGSQVNMTVTPQGSITIQFFVDNGEYYLMTGTLSEDGITITGPSVQYQGSSACGANDVRSTFRAILYQPVTGTYNGTLTPDAGGDSFSATISLSQDSNFNVTGTVTASDNPCFADLTVNSAVYPSFVSGNIVLFTATDQQGDVISLLGNTGGPNDNSGDTNWLQFFVSAVSFGGACTGQSYTDDTFHKVRGERKAGR